MTAPINKSETNLYKQIIDLIHDLKVVTNNELYIFYKLQRLQGLINEYRSYMICGE